MIIPENSTHEDKRDIRARPDSIYLHCTTLQFLEYFPAHDSSGAGWDGNASVPGRTVPGPSRQFVEVKGLLEVARSHSVINR